MTESPAATPPSLPNPLRVAIVGAGPAGIYAGNILAGKAREVGTIARIDLFEALPAPYGLIRYGVAPDHPRIKGIVTSLHDMLNEGDIRLIGNVTVGRDVSVDELRARYHAVILATGAIHDAALNIPGIELDGSFGAADFVSWYDGNPDYPRDWPLEAERVAVIGNGNVALDVARVLAKLPENLMSTDIPANVSDRLTKSAVREVHLFGRRGPADVKFTPIELRELGEVEGVDIVVDDRDFEGIENAVVPNNQMKVMLRVMNEWRQRARTDASRVLHLHFFHTPTAVLGSDGHVTGMRFTRTASAPSGAGEVIDYPVEAIYRAVGYFGSPVAEVPFDAEHGVVPNRGGRVVTDASEGDASANDANTTVAATSDTSANTSVRNADTSRGTTNGTATTSTAIPGLYTTGWIKRGPVGLIGHTKSDALETIDNLMEDASHGRLTEPGHDADSTLELLDERGILHTDWAGWLRLDAHERALGVADAHPRERVKVVPRDEQVALSRAE